MPARRSSASSPLVPSVALIMAFGWADLASAAAKAAAPDQPMPVVLPPDGPTGPPRGSRPALPFLAGPLGELGTLAVANNQSECSVAVSGQHIVVGYNDFRVLNGSVSGVLYSLDGGATWNDGGTLPRAGTTDAVNGDPVVAVDNPPVGNPVFYYSSLYRNAAGNNTLCVHVSTDGGQSWSGPREVSAATNGSDLPDKEWLTVDPETGRLHITWTNFGTVTRLRHAYSDNGGLSWSSGVDISTGSGQGSSVAADPNSDDVYVAWRTYLAGTSSAITFVRSADNGVSWSAPASLSPSFFEVLPAYGFDRFNSFPCIAVNPADGGIELVYAASANGSPLGDFGDIFYRRSTDHGVNWSAPLRLNADVGAGAGRPQIFPSVSADASGRIDVVWYDESAGSGVSDLTDLFTTSSLDFGGTWKTPVPVDPTPFHNEVGNDFGAPHQGDYLQSVSRQGVHYATFAWFGVPDPLGTGADGMVSIDSSPADRPALRVRPGSVSITDTGCGADDGSLVAGEVAQVVIPLENFGPGALAGVRAVLSSPSPFVSVDPVSRSYPDLASGQSGVSGVPYGITLDAAYPCGTPLPLRLDLDADGRSPTYVEFTLPTGVVTGTTVLLSEAFDGVTAPALPAGWVSSVVAGTNTPWQTTTSSPASAPNAAFVADPGTTTCMQLQAPTVNIPVGTTFVDFAFDTRYDLEAQDARIAFDAGSFGYQLDNTGTTRFASSDCIEFDNRYTHWVSRASGGQRGDRSGYSGSSFVYKTVRVRIPNLAGHSINPRWHLTADPSIGATGWWVDNVRIAAITYGCGPCTPVAAAGRRDEGFALLGVRPNPMREGGAVSFSLPRPLPVWAAVVSVDGRRVRTLATGELFGPGRDQLAWDGLDAAGRRVPTGVYWVMLRTAEGQACARVVVLN